MENKKTCRYCVYSEVVGLSGGIDPAKNRGCKVIDPGNYIWVDTDQEFCKWGKLIPSYGANDNIENEIVDLIKNG